MTHESGDLVVDLIEDWCAYLSATGSSPNTIILRRRTMHALLAVTEAERPEQLTRMHIIAFLGRPTIKPWTRLTYWYGIRSWLDFCHDFDHPINDLLKGVPRPPTPDGVARPIADEHIDKLLELKLSRRTHAYVRLALFEALRVHEIAKVRAEDFDWDAGWLMVTGKGGRTAPVPIHPEIHKVAERMPEEGWWFPAPSDRLKHVSPETVGDAIGVALAQTGCRATAHQLRDTAATRIQRQVKDIRVTQSMMRHRNVATTQKYTRVADEDLQNAVLTLRWGEAA